MLKAKRGKKNFKPHMMYDPKTGKGYKANTYEDHIGMMEMGYVHLKKKPKKEEDYEYNSGNIPGNQE